MKRRTPLKRTGRLRPVSPRRAIVNAAYSRLRITFLAAHPKCQARLACKRGHSRDIHHVHGRGSNLLKPETWLAVCRRCHDAIHDNPKAARELGLLK